MYFDGVVFPGQGTQNVGMGKDFVDVYPEAKEIFNLAGETLNFDVYKICQENNEDQLNNTEYTQPCILTLEIIIFNILHKYFNFNPIFFAGHSLGEYAALVASKVIPFEIAIKIVHLRGKLMQSAGNTKQSAGMVALISDPMPLNEIRKVALDHAVDLANDNSKQQVVLSGLNNDLQLVINTLEKLLPEQPLRVVPLAVKAAFHSRYMQDIEKDFYNYIIQFKEQFNPQNLTNVISNYFGGFYFNQEIDTLIEGLTKQISGSVKWRDNMNNLLNRTQQILELGPAAPLRGFFKSIGITIQSITNVKSISKVFVS